jgi:small redox-active disulfide protein 2
MKVQILGSGCAACQEVAKNAEEAIKGRESEYEIEKVTDIAQIAMMGVMQTPAVAIDGNVKIKGKIASVEEIKAVL